MTTKGSYFFSILKNFSKVMLLLFTYQYSQYNLIKHIKCLDLQIEFLLKARILLKTC